MYTHCREFWPYIKMSLFNYTKRKGIDIHKSDSQSQSSIGQPMQKVAKLVLTGVVENGESMGRQ